MRQYPFGKLRAGSSRSPGQQLARACSMLFSRAPPPLKMKRNLFLSVGLPSVLWTAVGLGQSGPSAAPTAPTAGTVQYSTQGRSAQGSEPVSYVSVTQLNGLLGQLDA